MEYAFCILILAQTRKEKKKKENLREQLAEMITFETLLGASIFLSIPPLLHSPGGTFPMLCPIPPDLPGSEEIQGPFQLSYSH